MTPWTIAYQAPLFMEFSRQEYWSRLPFPSPFQEMVIEGTYLSRVKAIYDKCFSIYKKENNSSIIVIFKEKEMATYSSTLAWRIPWMEEPGRLQSMGFHGARQD